MMSVSCKGEGSFTNYVFKKRWVGTVGSPKMSTFIRSKLSTKWGR